MAHKITIDEVAENEGMTYDELIIEYGMDSVVPACCSEGCYTEPDGKCKHGFPSIMLALGVI